MLTPIPTDADALPPPRTGRREPDAHGQAALLLCESLIHALIARSVLSVEEAVETIETAAEIKVEIAAETHEHAAPLAESLALLEAMAGSLRRDVGR